MPIFNSNKVMFYPKKGDDGKSAYEVAVENGFVGTEKQWLASLVGGQPIYAETTEDMTDTSKLYVMPDKKVYAYFAKKVPVAVNSFDPNAENVHLNARIAYIAAKGAVYDEGVYNSSTNPNGIQITWSGSFITDYIPADLSTFNGNLKVKISGYSETDALLAWSTYSGGASFCYFDENKTHIGDNVVYINGAWRYTDMTIDDDGSVTFNLDTTKAFDYNSKNTKANLFAATKYVRFAFNPNGSRTSITQSDINNIKVEFEANTTQQSVYGWYDTGMTWTPTDYEERIVNLETEADEADTRITNLEEAVGTSADTIPDYWASEVDTSITTVKAKQNISGKDSISFVLIADMHIDGAKEVQVCGNVGKVAAKIMKECNIPLFVNAGDNLAGNPIDNETPETVYDDLAAENKILKYIDNDKKLTLLGNHDGCWGQTTVDGVTTYYDRAVSEEERFNLFMAAQGEDVRRIWGKDGTYFALDYPQRNTRFICLNSQDNPYTVGDDYKSTETPINNPMKKQIYPAEQLKWFADVINVPDGWNIVIATHIPPYTSSSTLSKYGVVTNVEVLRGIIAAYCNHTTYSGTVGSDTITADFTAAKGNVVGVFAGHVHNDYIVEPDTTLPCPIIIVTTAGSVIVGEASGNRTRQYGSSNETAFDVVTVDTKNHNIYLTRVGEGSDRQTSYTATGTSEVNAVWSLYNAYKDGDEVSY